MTKKQLLKFMRLRNKSEFQSNLQFQIDANACGFSATDLGPSVKQADCDYAWHTPYGTLREVFGKMSLEQSS